jgi:hypothetical protein
VGEPAGQDARVDDRAAQRRRHLFQLAHVPNLSTGLGRANPRRIHPRLLLDFVVTGHDFP